MVGLKNMEKIVSASNEKIKYLKKLGEKKYRDKSGEFLVENLRIIHDAVLSGFIPVSLFVSEKLLASSDERLEFVLDNADEYFIISDKVNKNYSNLSTPSGISAVFKKITNELDLNKIIIYLNKVSDPGNLGTILRTALAFDVLNIVVDEGCADIYNPKTISAAKDAILKLNIQEDRNLEIFNKIKNKMKVYSTKMDKGKEIGEIKDKQYCLVFGNEANGVSEEITKKSNGFVSIKTAGKIESINVAISAGIIFNEIWKKNN